MAPYAPINYAPPQGTAGAPQMIAAPTFQLPQLQAFSKNAQYTEAAANLANQLLQAYLKKQELNKGEAASSELADLLAVMDVAQGPRISAGPVQDPTAYAAPSQADQYQFVAKELIDSDLAANRARGIDMLTAALLKEPKELTEAQRRGAILKDVATEKQVGTTGPLARAEEAFQPIMQPLSLQEQAIADHAALRQGGEDPGDLSRFIIEREISDEYAQGVEERQEKRQLDKEIRDDMRTKAAELRAQGYEIQREGRAIRVGHMEAQRRQRLEKDMYEWQKNFDAGQAPDTFDETQKLRKEYAAVSGDYRDQLLAYEKLTATANSPAGDIALVTNFMKMLDPGSVVREGEFDKAASAAGLGERVVTILATWSRGDTLGVTQRNDLRETGKQLMREAYQNHQPIARSFEEIAVHYELEPDLIMMDWHTRHADELQQTSGSQEELPEITSPLAVGEIIDSNTTLPPGDIVIADDGLYYANVKGVNALYTGMVYTDTEEFKVEKGVRQR